MTMIPCMVCSGDGVVEQNRNCPTCGGSGEIEAAFGMTEGHRLAMFNMVTELVATYADLSDKLDNIMDKCNDIFEKVNE